MPTPITVSVNFIDLTGTAITGYMEAAIVSPSGVYDLYVAGTGMIAPKTITSTVGTSVSVQIWGNDVVVDAADGANDTYYTVNLFNTVNSLVWSAAYLFTGAGPINLVGFPILNPVPAPVAPTFPVVQPPGGSNGNVQYNNGSTFGGDSTFSFNAATKVISGTIFNATTGFEVGGAASSGNYLRGNGTNFVSSAIVVGDLPASYPWSNLGNAAGSLTLANGTNTSTFNHTSGVAWTWANLTAATNTVDQPSPALTLVGQAWLGIVPASTAKTYTIQEFNGNLQFTQAGSVAMPFPYQFDSSVQIRAQNNGPTNVVGAVLALTNVSGSVPSYILKDVGDNLTIRTDSATVSASPIITMFQAGNLQFSVPNSGTLTFNQGGANFGGGSGQVVLDMNQTGAAPHGFYLKCNSNPQSIFMSIDDGSVTQTNQVSISYVLTQVTVAGGTVTYTGTIPNGATNNLAGKVVAVTGFVNGGNNVTSFTVTGSTPTTLVGTTSTQVNETHAGAAQLNYSAPAIAMKGSWVSSGTPTADITTLQNVIGVGATPASQFVISNSGANAWKGVSVVGSVTAQTLIESTTHTPSSAADTGTTGQIAWDTGFVYICTATNTWKRVAIATW